MALLVAEYTDIFRATFAFGPVASVTAYGERFCPFDMDSAAEEKIRAPIYWLSSIRKPTFVFEGLADGNAEALLWLKNTSRNPIAHFYGIREHGHFDILAPLNELIANAILKDDGAQSTIKISSADVAKAVSGS